jgi:hypothetical protein
MKPSSPTRIERIRERTGTSAVSTGSWTRRPSAVTATATERRSGSFEKAIGARSLRGRPLNAQPDDRGGRHSEGPAPHESSSALLLRAVAALLLRAVAPRFRCVVEADSPRVMRPSIDFRSSATIRCPPSISHRRHRLPDGFGRIDVGRPSASDALGPIEAMASAGFRCTAASATDGAPHDKWQMSHECSTPA